VGELEKLLFKAITVRPQDPFRRTNYLFSSALALNPSCDLTKLAQWITLFTIAFQSRFLVNSPETLGPSSSTWRRLTLSRWFWKFQTDSDLESKAIPLRE
jgi:hypothetical protein